MRSLRARFAPLFLEAGTLVDLSNAPVRAGPPEEYLPFVFVACATSLVAVLLFVIRHRRRRDAEPVIGAAASSQGAELDGERRRRLREAMREGNHREAAELLREVERHRDAARYFVRANMWRDAAEAYAAAGEMLQAIHYFKRGGERGRVAELYADRGDPASAAAEYVDAGEDRLAAEHYAAAGEHERAGRHYASVGDDRRAARQFDRADLPELAGRHAARAFLRTLRGAEGDLEQLDEEDLQLAEVAGRAFAAVEEFDNATQILRRAGRLQRAPSIFREAGAVGKAASICEEALEAPARAASLYEEAGDSLRAASAYERAGELAEAARCFEEGGELARAAELHAEAGEVSEEIRVRISQGDYFRAGRRLLEQGAYERAVETLQRIHPRDPIYARSLELQGDVYRTAGAPSRACRRYREALEGREPSEATIGVYYKLARLLERREKWGEALDCYHAISRVDSGFRDVAKRRRAIQRARKGEGEVHQTVVPDEGDDTLEEADATPMREGISTSPGSDRGELRYEFVERIARGGMGVVYKARDTFLNRVVALKLLGEKLRDNDTAVDYFLREARAVASLTHPNIVTIFDAGEQEGDYYIAMEFVDGSTLEEIIESAETLSESETRRILKGCCRALEYAHERSIVHRDIKSDNIMLGPQGRVKIMDFGLAKFLREYRQEYTQRVGTPYYMSPEQIVGDAVDFRTDLYGLGCTAFECVTGRVPFEEGELGYHHVHTEPPRPSEFVEDLSDELEQIILRLLAKEPDDRFPSAASLLEVLERE